MARTVLPNRPPHPSGEQPLQSGPFDEAFEPSGSPRSLYAELIKALADRDLAALRERTASAAQDAELQFGPGRPIPVDPIPRLIDAREWAFLEAGLLQRARALNAFLADAYGAQRIFDAGIVPRRLLETSSGYEPAMRGLIDPGLPAATVAGLDLIRDETGRFRVLEDNLRMPSGACYAIAMREVVEPQIDLPHRPRDLSGYVGKLGEAIAAAAPKQGDEAAAILSEGPESGAWYEHRRLGRELGLPIVAPQDLETREDRLFFRRSGRREQVDVLYRRLDEDRLTMPDGRPTELGELLLPALRSGRLHCVNAFGTGLADDKLAHAYAERMVEFYLGEEPLLHSVPSFNLSDEEEKAMDRLDELVVKPRDGFGGKGVTIMARASEPERRRTIELVRRHPDRFIAQEAVELSTHPTVQGASLEPRRVDLRPFVISGRDGAAAMTGGLTRFARSSDDAIVNSSQGGGCKDTWVLTEAAAT